MWGMSIKYLYWQNVLPLYLYIGSNYFMHRFRDGLARSLKMEAIFLIILGSLLTNNSLNSTVAACMSVLEFIYRIPGLF